jgi:hypothetical protein
MDGDGLWMRCSRCHHVFFQENPLKAHPPDTTPQVMPVFTKEAETEKAFTRLVFEPAATPVVSPVITPAVPPVVPPTAPPAAEKIPDEVAAAVIDDYDDVTPEPPPSEEAKTESEMTDKGDMELADITFSREAEEADDTGETMDMPEEKPAPPVRKKSRRWKALLWTILVVFVIPAVISFLIFPKLGERYIKLGQHGAKQILNLFGGSKPSAGQYVAGFVKVQDFRQRFVRNDTLGRSIRIVEGTVLNQSDFSIARIMVKVELLDADSSVLSERVSYAGNVLTDQELSTLSDEEIMKRLSVPEGRNNLNERVIPDGQIPFMIVFTKDPSGTFKTSVIVSGAERLL